MIRVLIADDHTLVRQTLRALLEHSAGIEIVGEASNGRQAVELVKELEPDVVLMDMAMPGLNGLRAVEQIRAGDSRVRVVMLSMYSDEALVREALRKGAHAYLLKHDSYSDLLRAIQTVAAGGTFFSREISEMIGDVDAAP